MRPRGFSTNVARAALLLVASGQAACAPRAEVRLASGGDFAGLHAELAERQKLGSMSLTDVRSLAHAVLEHDVASPLPERAAAVVRELTPCSLEVDDILEARMAKADDPGAEAALLRIEAGTLDPASFQPKGGTSTAWSAAAARTLVAPSAGNARRALYLDPSPRVRRAAVRASSVGDSTEIDALAGVALRDPEPLVRTEAVRALQKASAELAGLVVDKLRDLWGTADAPLRGTIADALAMAPLREAGGIAPLVHWMATSDRAGRLEAATALLFARGPWVDGAFELVLEAAQRGSRPARLRALSVLPLDEPAHGGRATVAFREATLAHDPDVQIAGWSRLADSPDSRAEALAALISRSSPGDAMAPRAQFALAAHHDRRVQAWIEAGMSGTKTEKSGAIAGLVALGLPTRAAPLLADQDESVRDRAACMILVASRRVGAR